MPELLAVCRVQARAQGGRRRDEPDGKRDRQVSPPLKPPQHDRGVEERDAREPAEVTVDMLPGPDGIERHDPPHANSAFTNVNAELTRPGRDRRDRRHHS